MKRAGLILFVLVALVAFMEPPPAEACTCVRPIPCEADFVFVGWVEEVTYEGAPFAQTALVRFSVDYVFQGPYEPETIEARSGVAPGACGAFGRIQVGQPWLIYANGTEEPVGVSSCSRTRLLQDPYDFDQLFDQVSNCSTQTIAVPPAQSAARTE